MTRDFRRLTAQLVAACSVLLALGTGLDLHVLVDSGSAHGQLDVSHHATSGEPSLVTVEPCSQKDRRHFEGAEKEFSQPCWLCLRNLDNRSLASASVELAEEVGAFETRFLDEDGTTAVPLFSPKSVRGPPIS